MECFNHGSDDELIAYVASAISLLEVASIPSCFTVTFLFQADKGSSVRPSDLTV